MRSTQRDRDGTITLMASTYATPGSANFKGTNILFSWVKTAAGAFDLKFDNRLVPIAGVVGGGWDAHTGTLYGWGAGSVSYRTYVNSVPTDASALISITCLDKRI
jgi:hypothetical protein